MSKKRIKPFTMLHQRASNDIFILLVREELVFIRFFNSVLDLANHRLLGFSGELYRIKSVAEIYSW